MVGTIVVNDAKSVLIVELEPPFARRGVRDARILDKDRAMAGGTTAELSDERVRHPLTV